MIPKFRAWSKVEKIMSDVKKIDFCNGEIDARSFEETEIEEVVLMQSTGLFDKNGKEIFEGDALKNNDYPNQTFICKHSRLQASFQAESLNGLLTLSLWKDEERDWQVLGNIYENPELLDV